MRLESITAYAFGPFENTTLELSPGMTVVWGPNEAGKSSWHAALYAGLCGQRRGRGKPTGEEQEFIDRHRPWDGAAWEVGAVIALADGRRIELRHDLAGRVNCRAIDAALGRDYSAEIMFDGAPDGSRWLGLDRRSFLATACVRQADLMSVRDGARLLQDQLQRAAATGGADATAAAAIQQLTAFQAEQVGRLTTNSIRPLKRATDGLERARIALEEARRQHLELRRLAEDIDGQERLVARAREALARLEARRATSEVQQLELRLAAARALADRFPDGPPAATSTDQQRAISAGAALQTWRDRPDEPHLDGPSADDLRAELENLDQRQDTPAPASPGSQVISLVAGSVLSALGALLLLQSTIVPAMLLIAAGVALIVWSNKRRADAIARSSSPNEQLATLQAQIAARDRVEIAAAIAIDQRARASRQLHAAVAICGIADEDGDELLAARLEGWLQDHHRRLDGVSASTTEYARLARQAGEATVSELESRLEDARRHPSEPRASASGSSTRAASLQRSQPSNDDLDVEIDRLRQDLRDADQALAKLYGQRDELSRRLPSVAEAEEALAAAEQELARVERLQATLATTLGFLTRAQDRVHRDIAPVLADSVRQRLSRITAGRYQEVLVDPASLAVRVRDASGLWRDAELLSHGTAEQIYLLLRVALTEHLTQAGEVCPLILDDVTAHCDEERSLAVLTALHEISHDRQVILFTQEQLVRDWAARTLTGPSDRLVLLPSPNRLEVGRGPA